jgi:hypothetical protein
VLIRTLRKGNAGQKEWAAKALASLAFNHATNVYKIAEAGGIVPLVALAREGTAPQQDGAAAALAYLAFRDFENQEAIVAAGAIEPLISLARDGTAKRSAAAALANLLGSMQLAEAASDAAGGPVPLARLLWSRLTFDAWCRLIYLSPGMLSIALALGVILASLGIFV